jgi:hypothetical protein
VPAGLFYVWIFDFFPPRKGLSKSVVKEVKTFRSERGEDVQK